MVGTAEADDTELHLVTGPALEVDQLHELLKLRVDVFVVEQDCPYHEIDGRDLEATTAHLWLADELGVVSSLRILDDPAGRRVGRVVTRADRRGQRLSSKLIEEALVQIGHTTTVLDAQSHLREFYEGFGFEVSGPQFIEDGIPHLPMTRPAGPSGIGAS